MYAYSQNQSVTRLISPPHRSGALQRACACGQHTKNEGGECEECKQKREGTLQRSAVNSSPTHEVPSIVHEVLRSSGQPLDPDTRAFMEPRFGQDFSRVRIHTDAKAAESVRAVHALAYTVGQDMVFGKVPFSPRTIAGQKLLAHELTHTIQQAPEYMGSHMRLTVNSPGDPNELEAEQVSRAFVDGTSIPSLSQKTPPTVQRIIRTDEEFGQLTTGNGTDSARRGAPLPYRESTELFECLRLMGQENESYCREVVLGISPPSPAHGLNDSFVRPTRTDPRFMAPSDFIVNGVQINMVYDADEVTDANIRQLLNTLALLPARHLEQLPTITVGNRPRRGGGGSAHSGMRGGPYIRLNSGIFSRHWNQGPYNETLLHEVGHIVDWAYQCMQHLPSEDREGYQALLADPHGGATQGPSEHYADAYADYYLDRSMSDARRRALLSCSAFAE